MRFKILLPLLALSACGRPQVAPPPPHYVYCLTVQQLQEIMKAEPAKIGNKLDADARIANKQLVKQNILVRQYADGLLQILGGCAH